MERARAAAYSDDEYEDMSRFQRRRRGTRRGARENQYDPRYTDDGSQFDNMGQEDFASRQAFWDEAEREGRNHARQRRTMYDDDSQAYEKKFFDEFDDFFNFSDQGYDAARDDTRGADYKAELEVSFKEAINGCETQIHLNKRVVCASCHGRRADTKADVKPRRCFECGGRGSVIGNYGIRKKCPKCEGCGCTYKTRCDTCEGLGVQRITVTEDLFLPQGLVDGQKIRLQNLGHCSDCVQSAAGDLLVTIKVKEHETMKRDGQNIVSEAKISFLQAILGATIKVETVDGEKEVTVNAGTQNNDQVVLSKAGCW